jgi:hypothetical protein
MGARNRGGREFIGFIGWRNSFLRILSGAPYTFKNTGSVFCFKMVKFGVV